MKQVFKMINTDTNKTMTITENPITTIAGVNMEYEAWLTDEHGKRQWFYSRDYDFIVRTVVDYMLKDGENK